MASPSDQTSWSWPAVELGVRWAEPPLADRVHRRLFHWCSESDHLEPDGSYRLHRWNTRNKKFLWRRESRYVTKTHNRICDNVIVVLQLYGRTHFKVINAALCSHHHLTRRYRLSTSAAGSAVSKQPADKTRNCVQFIQLSHRCFYCVCTVKHFKKKT